MSNGRSAASELLQLAAGDERNVGPRQRLHIVVRDIEEEALKVERIAGDVKRYDLAGAIAGKLLAIRKS